jgi:hypothetical protein
MMNGPHNITLTDETGNTANISTMSTNPTASST